MAERAVQESGNDTFLCCGFHLVFLVANGVFARRLFDVCI